MRYETVYIYTTPFVYRVEYEPAPFLPSVDEGWSLLRDGLVEAAQDVFEDLIYALP